MDYHFASYACLDPSHMIHMISIDLFVQSCLDIHAYYSLMIYLSLTLHLMQHAYVIIFAYLLLTCCPCRCRRHCLQPHLGGCDARGHNG